MSKIYNEYEESKKIINKYFPFINNGRIKLTMENAKKAETLLKIDSIYRNASDIKQKPDEKFIKYLKGDLNTNEGKTKEYGSGAYWISRLVKLLNNEKITEDYTIDIVLKGVICAIDKENSTHLTARKPIRENDNKMDKDELEASKGRQRVYERLKSVFFNNNSSDKDFKEYINNPEKSNYEIIDIIANPKYKTSDYAFKEYPAENFHFSFATKFCRYVCIELNTTRNKNNEDIIEDISDEGDKYYIYDGIIWGNLKKYVQGIELNKDEEKIINNKDFYKEQNEGNNTNCGKHYNNYLKLLDKINEEDGNQISRNAFDHIIWYFNK